MHNHYHYRFVLMICNKFLFDEQTTVIDPSDVGDLETALVQHNSSVGESCWFHFMDFYDIF